MGKVFKDLHFSHAKEPEIVSTQTLEIPLDRDTVQRALAQLLNLHPQDANLRIESICENRLEEGELLEEEDVRLYIQAPKWAKELGQSNLSDVLLEKLKNMGEMERKEIIRLSGRSSTTVNGALKKLIDKRLIKQRGKNSFYVERR